MSSRQNISTRECLDVTKKIYTEQDLLMHKAEAVRHERQQCIKIASESVLKFRAKVDRSYYPGYHEDMRDYIKAELKKER